MDAEIESTSYSTSKDESSSRTLVKQKLYCICRRASAGYMIQCDCCSEWFHGKCVGIKEGHNPTVFLCNNCCQDDWLACEMLLLLSDKQSIQKFIQAQKEYLFKTRRLGDSSSSSEGLSEEDDEEMEEDPSIGSLSDDEDYNDTAINTRSPPTLVSSYEDGISPRQNFGNGEQKDEKTMPPGSPAPLGINHTSPRQSLSALQHKSKKRKNESQMSILMKYYEHTPDPDLNTKKKIADETSLTVKQVSDWFYNLRVRKKYKVSLN